MDYCALGVKPVIGDHSFIAEGAAPVDYSILYDVCRSKKYVYAILQRCGLDTLLVRKVLQGRRRSARL